MTRRRWIAATWTDTTASLTGEQAGHLARVLRAEPGQIFDVLAGGFLRRAEITAVSEREVTFALGEELETDAALPVHLLLAVIKFDHYEWGLGKSDRAWRCAASRQCSPDARKSISPRPLRSEWNAGARSLAKPLNNRAVVTSRRSNDPQPLKAALAAVTAAHKVLLAETEQENTLGAALQGHRMPNGPAAEHSRQLALAIGPEGGWAPEELQLFQAEGWHPVTLGPRVLRAETAAIAGFGDLLRPLL